MTNYKVERVIALRGRDDLEAEQPTLQRTLMGSLDEEMSIPQIILAVWWRKCPHVKGPDSLEEGGGGINPEGS